MMLYPKHMLHHRRTFALHLRGCPRQRPTTLPNGCRHPVVTNLVHMRRLRQHTRPHKRVIRAPPLRARHPRHTFRPRRTASLALTLPRARPLLHPTFRPRPRLTFHPNPLRLTFRPCPLRLTFRPRPLRLTFPHQRTNRAITMARPRLRRVIMQAVTLRRTVLRRMSSLHWVRVRCNLSRAIPHSTTYLHLHRLPAWFNLSRVILHSRARYHHRSLARATPLCPARPLPTWCRHHPTTRPLPLCCRSRPLLVHLPVSGPSEWWLDHGQDPCSMAYASAQAC